MWDMIGNRAAAISQRLYCFIAPGMPDTLQAPTHTLITDAR
jgi:hypothetical protein